MTRYYYTGPLAAAWMAKHFGMQVTRTRCHRGDGAFGESIQPVPIWILARDVENQVSENVKYYIHPDSLHLLDVQYGDLTLDDDPMDYGHRWLDVSASAYMRKNFNRIIQRNGILFHWPEVEHE